MNSSTSLLLDEMRGKMSGYAVQYSYLLSNLSVKTEAAALLSIQVEVSGMGPVNLEEVAMAGILDDTHFFFYPNDKSLIPNIQAGIQKAHPEYKLSTGKVEGAPGDNDEQVIARIPPVDDDRQKELKDAVKTLSDACKARLDATSKLYSARIVMALLGESAEAQDEAKNALKEICDWHSDLCKQYQENKEKEIDAAHEAWQKEGGGAEEKSDSGSGQSDAAFNMKMQ